MNDRDIHVLAGRLNTGWVMIEVEPDDAKRARLEDHWIDLLRRYEDACDQAIAAPVLVAVPERRGVAA